MEKIDYLKIFEDFKLNNQFWFAELSSGYILEVGFGFVDDEFPLDTWVKIHDNCKDIYPDDILKNIEGFYEIDDTSAIYKDIENKMFLSDLGYESHPDDNIYCLIPKCDVVKTWFNINKK